MVNIDFQATSTMQRFMDDPSYVRLLAGPVGSGKSVCSVIELLKLATQQAPNKDGIRKTRSLIIRNTLDQLRSTTMKTWHDWAGPAGYYKASEKTFYVDQGLGDGTRVQAEFMFLPLDSPDDVRRVLSLEATFAWINEAREVRPEIIEGVLMRLRRYPSMRDGGPTRSCAILDTNMPDVDSWFHDRMENPPENWSVFIQPPSVLTFEEYYHQEGEEPEESDGTVGPEDVRYWVNPRADNVNNLDPLYYPDIIPGKSIDFVNVYLRCRYGRSLSGVPVYEKTFNPEFHIADEPFKPIRAEGYPLIIGLDFGRTPAACIFQRNVYGQVVCHAELTSQNMGIETFINTKLKPMLSEPRFLGIPCVVAPDPAGWSKQQIGEVSPVDIIKQQGFQVVKPTTNDPARRIEAVERLLLQHTDGKPMLIINPECDMLIKGFRYGYKYKVNKNTGVQDNKPEKGDMSHVHDSAQYGCMVIEGGAGSGSVMADRTRREVKVKSAVGWT